jgi:hypothetical protein
MRMERCRICGDGLAGTDDGLRPDCAAGIIPVRPPARATQTQVDYALLLLDRRGQSEPYSREQLETWSKTEISALIDALKKGNDA